MTLVKHIVVKRFELFIKFCALGGSSAPHFFSEKCLTCQVFLDSVRCFPWVLAIIGPSDLSRDP